MIFAMMKNILTNRLYRAMIGVALGVLLIAISAYAVQSENESKSESKRQIDNCLAQLPDEVKLAGAMALIGSNNAYPEERPARQVQVAGFSIDATEVTNKQFRSFVEATNYLTDAEKIQPGFNTPGGAVFILPNAAHPHWWRFVEGANWRHPEGPKSSIKGRDYDPVVQLTINDARAYAKWVGRRLPTEIEWEYAAGAGAKTRYVWGEEKNPNGKEMANTWQGAFPIENTQKDGFALRAPVGCFEPNAFGLYDMIGNVWEWTDTANWQGQEGEAVYVIKGGSFLCAENYCRRYRASARQFQEAGLSTNHIGFRTAK